MPPVAGLLHWTKELKERIGGGMEKLRHLNHGYNTNVTYNYGRYLLSSRTMETAEAVAVCSKYDEMVDLIRKSAHQLTNTAPVIAH